MKAFQRILAVVLCLILCMSAISMVAFAADGSTIDTTKKGSITVHKYEYNGTSKGTGTGEATENLPDDATPLEGVKFAIYQVMTQDQMLAYYNGSDDTAVIVDRFVVKNEDGSYTVKDYSDTEVSALETLTTDSTGVVVFDGIYDDATTVDDETKTDTENGKRLPLGMYVIIETSAPEKVTVAEKPFLVSVPMTKASNDSEWLYDINVYPKNSTSEGNVILKKTDENGHALEGVTFKLEKGNSTGTYTLVNTITTPATGQIEWTGLAYGDYRITEVSAPAGYIVDQRPIFFTVNRDNTIEFIETGRACISADGDGGKTLTITLKNEKPDVEKVIVEDGVEVKEANAAACSTVSYKVTVDVPENITELKTFTLTDTPSSLYDQVNTVELTCNGQPVDTSAYTVTEMGAAGFTITFVPENMGAYAGKTIIVTYDAKMDVSGASTHKNTVDLTYSNKIKADSTEADTNKDKNHIEDSAVVYSYEIDITKYADSLNGERLASVEFELYKGDDLVRCIQHGNGLYFAATADHEQTVTTLVTNTDGQLKITGLDSGTYYLKEIKTADGYNLLKDKVEVNLNLDSVTEWTEGKEFVENADGSYTLVKYAYKSTTYTYNNNTVTTNIVSQDIINKKGFELPQTGGIGTLMFIIIGGVLIAGGVCMIAVPNKKRSV